MAGNEIKYIITADSSGAMTGVKKFEDAVSNSSKKVTDTSSSMVSSFTKITASVAAVYGSYKSLEKAIEMSAIGSALQKQELAFSNLAKNAGASYKHILDNLTGVSKGMIAQSDLIKNAGTAMMMGIPADKLANLMKIAEATSRQTGQTVTEAFNDITLAVARGSKMILDNLGIIVDVEKANQTYAAALGKTSDSLTDVEKKQAFLNATLKAGNDLVKQIGESRGDLDAANRLSASFKNLMDESYKIIATLLNPALEKSTGLMDLLTKAAKEFRETITPAGQAIKSMTTEQMRKEVEQYDNMNPVRRSGAYTGQHISQIEAMRKALKEFDYNRGESESVLADNRAAYIRDTLNQQKRYSDEGGRNKGRVSGVSITKYEQEESERLAAQDKMLRDEADKVTKELETESERLRKKAIEDEKKLAEERLKVLSEFQKEAMALIGKQERPEESEARRFGHLTGGNANRDNEIYAKERAEFDKKWNEEATERSLYYARLKRDQQEEQLRKDQELHRQFANSLQTNVTDPLMDFVAGTQSFRDTMQQVLASLLKDLQRFIFELSQSGGESGGGGLFGTLFSLAGTAISAYYGGGTTDTGMTTNTFQGANTGGTGSGWSGGYSAANGGIFPGGFKAFANGGTVNKPTLGLVGEGRFNEAIVPLPDGRSIPVQMQGGGSRDVNVTINVSGKDGGTPQQNDKMAKTIAREVREQVKQIIMDERRYGGSLGRQSMQRAY